MNRSLMLAPVPLLLFSAFCWGANFPLAHIAVGDLAAPVAAVYRFGLAAAVMLGVAWMRGEPIQLLRHFKSLGLLALIGIIGFNALFFAAMQLTSPTNGALVMATNPLLTASLAALFLGEQVQRRQILAMPLALIGVAVVLFGNGASFHLQAGDALMLGADLSWAAYNVLVRRLMPAVSAVTAMTALMVYATIGLAVVALVMGAHWTLPGVEAGSAVLLMGTIGTAVAYMAYTYGIQQLGAAKAALFLNTVPVWAMVVSALIYAPPTTVQLIGGALVLVAVAYATAPRRAVTATA